MARIINVTDLSSPGLDVYTRLTEAQLRNRLEPEKGIFIAESPKVINTALDCGFEPVSMLMEKKHLNGDAEKVIAKCGDIPVYTAERAILEQLTGFTLTRGVLCAFKRKEALNAGDIIKDAERVAVLENIVDSTNIGAIFRSAAALGIDAVLLTPSCCDPLYRRAVRVSMGTVFQIPWARIGDEPSDWPEKGIEFLHSRGFKTAAMALCDDTKSVDDPELKSIDKLALILGTEGDGLSKETINASDYTIKIPMYHGVDSLNVAAASAVAFWELRAKR